MSRLTYELRRAKWELRVAGRRTAKRRFRRRPDMPTLFGCAMAKSGSHALSQLLEGLAAITDLIYTDMHPIRTRLPRIGARSSEEVLRDLGRLRRGDIGWGYLPAIPTYLDALADPRWYVLFLSRDPRDKLISEIHYALRMHPKHGFREHLLSLPTMEERISASISGVPGIIKGIAGIYESYQGWLSHPRTRVVRFEDLILERGRALTTLVEDLGRAGVQTHVPQAEALRSLDAAMSPSKSPTFRSARPGGWRAEFTARNVMEFKQATGDLLQRWGYETDKDWAL